MIKFQGRHGDVFFELVERLPEGATLIECTDRYVAALGEQTGHSHTVVAPQPMEVWEDKAGNRYLLTGEGVVVTHEEHGIRPLLPGIVRVIHQREQDWLADAVRRVVD